MSNKKNLRGLVSISCLVLLTLVLAGATMVGHIMDTSPAATESGTRAGLRNDSELMAPEAVTKEDLQAQNELKAEMSYATQDMLEASIMQYLSRGDFSGLDSFIASQDAIYKNGQGDAAQALENWQSQFDMIRADLATIANLTPENASTSFTQFNYPEILAAAIVYSPISVKQDAFIDRSAVMFPAVSSDEANSVSLKPLALENASALLAEINHNTNGKYTDIVAFEMNLFGYRCQLVALGTEYYYYCPYTLQEVDGKLVSPITRKEILEYQKYLDPYSTIDDVVFITPYSDSMADEPKNSKPFDSQIIQEDSLTDDIVEDY